MLSFVDSDWASCPNTSKCSWGFAIFIGNNLVDWSEKRKLDVVALSSTEAEYIDDTKNLRETEKNAHSAKNLSDFVTKP